MNFTRGDTHKFKFHRLDANQEIIETVADEVWFTVKENFNTDVKLIQKTLTAGEINFDDQYYYHVTIEGSDTSGFTYNKLYVYDIQVMQSGVIKTIAKGTISVTEEVTFEVGVQNG